MREQHPPYTGSLSNNLGNRGDGKHHNGDDDGRKINEVETEEEIKFESVRSGPAFNQCREEFMTRPESNVSPRPFNDPLPREIDDKNRISKDVNMEDEFI